MTKIPFADINYNIDAGVINKGNVNVQVFEISATYKNILFGLNAKNKKYDLKNFESGINNEVSRMEIGENNLLKFNFISKKLKLSLAQIFIYLLN